MNDHSANAFRTTHWTQVLAAIGESTEAKHALRDLCEAYYGPVEAFIGRYRAGHDDARDLTQQFFAKLLEGNSLKGVERTRGRFRTYLLGAVKHFLSDQIDRTLAEKRGSGQSPLSLEASPGLHRSERQEHTPLDVADPHGFPPDAFFDRQWALAIVEKAMSVLEAESQDRGETKRFEVLRRWLIPSDDGTIAALAARSLDMSDGAFKVAVHRLRKRFRQLVKDRIALSVDGPEALQGELDYLIQALTASESSHDSSTYRLMMLSGKINPSLAVSHQGAAASQCPSQQRPPKRVQ
jgi:DNA-directed RNA polymerase specialized sigma24 family protein